MDVLGDVSPDKAFYFRNGSTARNLYELSQGINALDEDSFKHHCNLDHDDFANWVGGALGDIVLSQKLRYVKDKGQYLKTIDNKIKALERKTHTSQLNKQFSEQFRDLMKTYGHIWLIIFIMIVTSIFTAMIYYQYHSLQNIKALDEKIQYIESRNTCFNNYFNEQIISTKNMLDNATFLDNYCVYNYTTSTKIPDDVMENTPAVIKAEDIVIDGNKVIITLENSSLSTFASTSSMLPTLNHNTKAIEIAPKNLNIGDIISYDDGTEVVVHRIVDIGSDDKGIYYIAKGDNNNVVDPNKIRREQIQGKIVVLMY
jgi:hypothetical protein